jgi:hypothetical protein
MIDRLGDPSQPLEVGLQLIRTLGRTDRAIAIKMITTVLFNRRTPWP